MKAALYALIRRLAAFVLLSACAEFLLPRGETRKYARFAAGLILLDAALSPLARFLGRI